MSALGERWRVAVWNASGITLPAGGITVRYRRWRFDSSGVYIPESSGQSVAVGASLVSGAGASSAAITNNGAGEQWLGADFIIEMPALTGTAGASATIEVYLQVSTDGGTAWADVPDVRRGLLLASFSVTGTNPAAQDLQSRV